MISKFIVRLYSVRSVELLQKPLMIFLTVFCVTGFGLSIWEISADHMYSALSELIPPDKLEVAQNLKASFRTPWLVFSGGGLLIFLVFLVLHFIIIIADKKTS